MKTLSAIFFLVFYFVSFLTAQQIPETIKTDLTLKSSPKPYTSNGFTVEKGATLTLLPGVKIILSLKEGDKSNYPRITINGALKVLGGAKPSVFIEGNPVIVIKNGTIDISGLEAKSMAFRIYGETSGTIKDSFFNSYDRGDENWNFEFTVPQKSSLVFTDTQFHGRGVKILTDNFPNDIANLKITKCAFTTYIDTRKQKLTQYFVPITFFAYSTQCDLYLDIKFLAFNWELKKPLQTECYIGDEGKRKTLEGSLKDNKFFSMKLPTKAFTKFKQEEIPAPAEPKKK